MTAKHPHDEFPTARIQPDELAQLRELGRASNGERPAPVLVPHIELWEPQQIEPIEEAPLGTPAFGTSVVVVDTSPTIVMPLVRFTRPSCAIVLPQRSRAPVAIAITLAGVVLAGLSAYFLL